MAWRPEASKVGARGPLPSVGRRSLSGSNLCAVAPWPLRYMSRKREAGVELVPPNRAEAPKVPVRLRLERRRPLAVEVHEPEKGGWSRTRTTKSSGGAEAPCPRRRIQRGSEVR